MAVHSMINMSLWASWGWYDINADQQRWCNTRLSLFLLITFRSLLTACRVRDFMNWYIHQQGYNLRHAVAVRSTIRSFLTTGGEQQWSFFLRSTRALLFSFWLFLPASCCVYDVNDAALLFETWHDSALHDWAFFSWFLELVF